ncbi:MAG: hypothetical protein J6A37_04475 [Oscillospiraceae bacterium]|nr:hypothetical protein [Oscillospiraceae bacterium]
MTKEKIKTALKSILKAIKVMLIILFILTLPFTIKSIPFIIDQIQDNYAAQKRFKEICNYVRKNEQVFIEFTEYQSSLTLERKSGFIIEHEGEMQDKRDIIFQYFRTSSTGIDEDGNAIVSYQCKCGKYGSYEITLLYFKGYGKNSNDDTETSVTINDNMRIFMLRTGF